ncbi:MAG: DnaD domain protein [Bacilli bacterium]|nr:DnaD domain protein [Bacilli bacterium]
MKYGNLMDIVKQKNIVIPIYIYRIFHKFDIDLETFIFLMYLSNKGNKLQFDVLMLAEELSCDMKTIMKYMATLQEKKLIELKVTKNEKNIIEEYISLDFYYEKVAMNLVENINEKKEDSSTIFEILEEELGKQLTSIEIEIVKAWKESNYSDEIIKEAIKEAVYNNVANLRYIDKVLYEWAKKGIKTKEDVEKNRKQFKEKEKPKKVDVFDYDWMEDSNEY